jgi:hypothetical protein
MTVSNTKASAIANDPAIIEGRRPRESDDRPAGIKTIPCATAEMKMPSATHDSDSSSASVTNNGRTEPRMPNNAQPVARLFVTAAQYAR